MNLQTSPFDQIFIVPAGLLMVKTLEVKREQSPTEMPDFEDLLLNHRLYLLTSPHNAALMLGSL